MNQNNKPQRAQPYKKPARVDGRAYDPTEAKRHNERNTPAAKYHRGARIK